MELICRTTVRARLTMLVIVGTRTEAHFLRSQVWIGSDSDCLFIRANVHKNLAN